MIDPAQFGLFLTAFPADPQSAQTQGASHGLDNRDACEVSAWCWELAEQLKSLSTMQGLHLIMIGGTATQLRIAAKFQRGSRDDDYLTDATEAEIVALMDALAAKFASFPSPQFRPERKNPGPGAPTLPMITFEVVVPALLGHLNFQGEAQHVIKLEFHFAISLPPTETVTGEVFALTAPVVQEIPEVGYQIAMKLMTLADPPVGLPPLREDDLPKHVHDLDGLAVMVRTPADWSTLLTAVEWQAKHDIGVSNATTTPAQILEQIAARMDTWATTPKALLIRALNGQLTKPSRVGPSAWRARFRRLRYLVECVAAGAAGGQAWFDALAEAETILADGNTPVAHAEVAGRWPAAHGTPMPKPVKSLKADQLLWELLGS